HTLSPSYTLRRLLVTCPKPAIIFERSRPGTRSIAEQLRMAGFPDTRFYHAGLSRTERNALEAWFQESNSGVLVSTNAYGMGVDKKNIRTVIHTSLPDSVEAYIQEAGRGGRDGKPALALLIHVPDEDRGSTVKADSPTDRRRARIAPYPWISGCRREFLLSQMGQEATPVCGTCDNCALPGSPRTLDEVLVRTEGFSDIRAFFAQHRRQLRVEQAVKILGHEGKSRFLAGGILSHWTDIERTELLQNLLRLGVLEATSRGLWKNTIDLKRVKHQHRFAGALKR
ncbi:MAG: helicase-related protein, partial [Rectinema sp.]|nr:helicase-related protein [Rectinema sp.]